MKIVNEASTVGTVRAYGRLFRRRPWYVIFPIAFFWLSSNTEHYGAIKFPAALLVFVAFFTLAERRRLIDQGGPLPFAVRIEREGVVLFKVWTPMWNPNSTHELAERALLKEFGRHPASDHAELPAEFTDDQVAYGTGEEAIGLTRRIRREWLSLNGSFGILTTSAFAPRAEAAINEMNLDAARG